MQDLTWNYMSSVLYNRFHIFGTVLEVTSFWNHISFFFVLFQKKTEALNLVKQMTLYYGKEAGDRYKLLRTFHLKPEEFNYMDIVDQYKENREYLENNPY